MTMPRFAHKRIGYLAANQCFTEDTEVVLLCTNHLQKEFKSQNPVSRQDFRFLLSTHVGYRRGSGYRV